MKILGPGLPGPKFAHPLMMKLFKRGTVKSAHGHGIGRHSEEEVKKIGLADLKVSISIFQHFTLALTALFFHPWTSVAATVYVEMDSLYTVYHPPVADVSCVLFWTQSVCMITK